MDHFFVWVVFVFSCFRVLVIRRLAPDPLTYPNFVWGEQEPTEGGILDLRRRRRRRRRQSLAFADLRGWAATGGFGRDGCGVEGMQT